jgi:predicted O-methyltransferase YrrM
MSIETHANRQAVVDLASSIGAKTVVEIGVRRGRLSILLVQVPTLERLYLIDTWADDEPFNKNDPDKTKVKKNARSVKRWARSQPNVTVLHMSSSQAVEEFADGSIDFVYLDGDHSFAGVTSDIRHYVPKLRKGGIISGDDYNLPTVSKVVDELIPNRNLILNSRIWWAIH